MGDVRDGKQGTEAPVAVPGNRLTGTEVQAEVGEDMRANQDFDPARPDLVRERKQTGRVPEQTKSNTETSPEKEGGGELNRPEVNSAVMDPVITANPD